MIVLNKHKTALALPGGHILPPGEKSPVHNWDRLRENAVIRAWLKVGILVEVESLEPSELIAPDREAIVARLKELGVSFHPATKTEKLQAKLKEAEAAAAPAAATGGGEDEAGSDPASEPQA